MTLSQFRDKLMKQGKPTLLGWMVMVIFIVSYIFLKHVNQVRHEKRAAELATEENKITHSEKPPSGETEPVSIPEPPLPQNTISIRTVQTTGPTLPPHLYNQPSFANSTPSNKILSDDFLPKGTILYATLTADIVSNNQISPAMATVIEPVIFAHKVRIPVGTQITGKISPGNLRGRVFVAWDTLVFYEEGRQGWEIPIKGIGMTYEEHPNSHHWFINGAGLKGYIFDDSSATAFKLASLRAMQDFAKTLQTFVTTQNSAITSGSAVTTTTTTPQATLQNSGLGAAGGFIDVIAARYAANLQQQNSYVLVPTAKLCAIFLDEPIDITAAAPGRSLQTATR